MGGRVHVRERTAGGALRAVRHLNELEMDLSTGWLWANVWFTDRIAVIDPDTGLVGRWLRMPKSVMAAHTGKTPDAVANGIAFDHPTGRVFVTGKWWNKLYEVEPPRMPMRTQRTKQPPAPSPSP
jgi:glutaminyl-peptide cyclotransferase